MWYDGIIKGILQSPIHSIVSSGIMLLKYTGRKSGRRYSVPISYTPDEENDLLWTVSLRKRTWWRNLRANTPVTLRFKGQDRLASADVLETPEDVREGLNELITLAPIYARYLDIDLDADGNPVAEMLEKAIEKRIVVRFKLVG